MGGLWFCAAIQESKGFIKCISIITHHDCKFSHIKSRAFHHSCTAYFQLNSECFGCDSARQKVGALAPGLRVVGCLDSSSDRRLMEVDEDNHRVE